MNKKNKLVNPESIVLISITFICFYLSNVNSSVSFYENDVLTNVYNNPSALQKNTCGNGILEDNEQCDCGRKDCGNCCDGKTCVLNSTACCGSGPCCNPKTCFPYTKIENVVCRKADNECDLPEYCNGVSEFCPENRFKQDGIKCLKPPNNARCFKGKCVNHALQCARLWGRNVSQSHWTCFSSKLKGKTSYPCQIDRKNNRTGGICNIDDTTCGLLYCNAPADTKLVLKEPFAGNKKHFVANNSWNCLSLEGSLSPSNPGMVPNGSPCGTSYDGMCVGFKCVPLINILQANKPCRNNCSGHGICNNIGTCHCDPLYTNTDCSVLVSDNSSQIMNKTVASPISLTFKPTEKEITECREKMGISTTSASSKPINLSTFTLAIIIGFLLSVLVSVAVLWNLYHRYGSSNTEETRPTTTSTTTPPRPAPTNPTIPPN